MKVVDANGRESVWNFAKYAVAADDTRPRSSLHLRARALLSEAFPTRLAYEEVPMPGTSQKFDFVVPSIRLVVEVQGEQHFKHSAFLHGTKQDFFKAKRRDGRKVEFCENNNLTLVHLRHDESDAQWHALLLAV